MAVCILLVGTITLAFAGLADAQSFRSGNNVNTGTDEKIGQTLFAAGATVDINSEVDGDVFCAGRTVTVSGVVHGDVICAGQSVTVSGVVDGDVRLAGQSVTLGAQVAGNATVGGQTFVLTSEGKIGRDISIGSTSATLDGDVGRDVALGSSEVILDGRVGRNVVGTVENLNVSSRADVRGDLTYTSNNELNRSDKAKIGGTVSRITPPKQESERGAVFGFQLIWFIYWLLAFVLLTFVLTLLFPRLIDRASRHGMPWPWKPLLVGLLASIIVPIGFIVAAATVVGLPLALIILLSWILIEVAGIACSSYYLGRIILRSSTKPLLIALVGSAVLSVGLFLPFIGILIFVLAAWIGEGLVLLTIRDHYRKPTYDLSPGMAKK